MSALLRFSAQTSSTVSVLLSAEVCSLPGDAFEVQLGADADEASCVRQVARLGTTPGAGGWWVLGADEFGGGCVYNASFVRRVRWWCVNALWIACMCVPNSDLFCLSIAWSSVFSSPPFF